MSPRPLQGPSTAQLGSYTAKDLLSAAFARHTSTDNLSSRLNKLQVRDRPHTHTHLSAPAQDNILLIRITWKGCRRTRMWKPSLPQVFTMYLLAQIRAASRARTQMNRWGKKWRQYGSEVVWCKIQKIWIVLYEDRYLTFTGELLIFIRYHVILQWQ